GLWGAEHWQENWRDATTPHHWHDFVTPGCDRRTTHLKTLWRWHQFFAKGMSRDIQSNPRAYVVGRRQPAVFYVDLNIWPIRYLESYIRGEDADISAQLPLRC